MESFILKIKKNSAFFYENEDMSKHCSFKAGEKAKYYCEPKNRKALAEIIKICKQNNLKFYVIGNGTNVLFYDYSGIVICLKQLRSIDVVDDILISEAGVSLFRLNMFAGECGFAGLEWSYGIPGTIGGATIMNAGAYGHEISEFIEKVEIFDGNRFKTLKKNKFWFHYRNSFFQENKMLVTRVYIKLTKLKDNEEIKEKMLEYFDKRKANHPLDYPSAGSVFKRNEDIIPARIIDSLGLKGTSINGAEVSTKHAGFIINKGGATVKDIEQLAQLIQKTVKKKKNINLEREIIIVKE